MSTKITRGARRHLLRTVERMRRRHKFGPYEAVEFCVVMHDRFSNAARKAAISLKTLEREMRKNGGAFVAISDADRAVRMALLSGAP